MATRSLLMVVGLTMACLWGVVVEGRTKLQEKVGSYRPITNLKDPNIVDIAKFAVEEHNKEDKSKLEFVKVEEANEQIISGKAYGLVITAKEKGIEYHYEATVYETPQQGRMLDSFDVIHNFVPHKKN